MAATADDAPTELAPVCTDSEPSESRANPDVKIGECMRGIEHQCTQVARWRSTIADAAKACESADGIAYTAVLSGLREHDAALRGLMARTTYKNQTGYRMLCSHWTLENRRLIKNIFLITAQSQTSENATKELQALSEGVEDFERTKEILLVEIDLCPPHP